MKALEEKTLIRWEERKQEMNKQDEECQRLGRKIQDKNPKSQDHGKGLREVGFGAILNKALQELFSKTKLDKK